MITETKKTPRSALALVVACLVFMVAPAAAAADDEPPKPPDDIAAVDAYRESLPTSKGPRLVGTKPKGAQRLPQSVRGRLAREGGTDRAFLEQLATSPELGAPRAGRQARERGPEHRAPSTFSAAAGALGEDGGDKLLWLLIGLVAIGAAAIGGLLVRGRSSPRP